MVNTFWNSTDHSVVVDADGRCIDGGAFVQLARTPEVQKAIELGTLVDKGPSDPTEVDDRTINGSEPLSEPAEVTGEQVADSDTNTPSPETPAPSETLPPKASAKRKSTARKNEEK